MFLLLLHVYWRRTLLKVSKTLEELGTRLQLFLSVLWTDMQSLVSWSVNSLWLCDVAGIWDCGQSLIGQCCWSLSGHDLHSIDVELFNQLTSLTELDLSDNQLTDIPRELTLPKLTILDLAENKLSSVDFVTQFPNLKSLYLKNNTQLKVTVLFHKCEFRH